MNWSGNCFLFKKEIVIVCLSNIIRDKQIVNLPFKVVLLNGLGKAMDWDPSLVQIRLLHSTGNFNGLKANININCNELGGGRLHGITGESPEMTSLKSQ